MNEKYWKGEINKKFIDYLLKEGIIFEHKPSRFKFLIKIDGFEFDYEVEEVIILEWKNGLKIKEINTGKEELKA